jgi:hypothetical protein
LLTPLESWNKYFDSVERLVGVKYDLLALSLLGLRGSA